MSAGGATPGPGIAALIPGRSELAALVRLAIPVVTVQVGMMTLGVADTVMVGRVTPADLAAVALGNYYFFFAVVFGMGSLMALDPIIAQAVGARDEVAMARGVQRGLLLAAVFTLMASLVMAPAEWVLTWTRQPAEVIPLARDYVWVSIPGVFPFLAFVVMRQSLQAMDRLAPIVWTIVATNLLNIVLNWVLIFGNLGFPAMGAVGSAWASTIGRWAMLLVLAGLAWKRLRPVLVPLRPEVLKRTPMGRMLRVGAPVGVQMSVEFWAFGTTGFLMGTLGTVAVAGHQIALNLASLTFMVPLGIAQAAAVLVGRAVGAEDPARARRSAGAGLGAGVAFMTVSAAAFLLLPELLARAYTPDPTVLALAATLIPIAGIFQVADGTQVVAAGVLRGVGDTRAPMVVNILGFWVIGIPVGVWLCYVRDWGPRGLWWGLAWGLSGVAILLLARVRVRFGRALRRLVIDHD